MSTKVTQRLAEAMQTVARGRPLDTLSSVLHECLRAGLVAIDVHGEQILTPAGAAFVAAFERKNVATRVRRRRVARARCQAMASLGLTRTRYGWE